MAYSQVSDFAANLRAVNSFVWCYHGDLMTPKWKDVDTGESYLTIIFLASFMS